jgi:ribosomal protein S8E
MNNKRKMKKKKENYHLGAEGVAQEVEHLPSNHKTIKKKKKKKKPQFSQGNHVLGAGYSKINVFLWSEKKKNKLREIKILVILLKS